MDRLHKLGLISDPKKKSKSVSLSNDACDLVEQYIAEHMPSQELQPVMKFKITLANMA